MGCDIHMYRERKVNGKWESCDDFIDIYEDGNLDVPYEKRFSDRNYNLFGVLSKGVRQSYDFSFEARGLPIVVCNKVNQAYNDWGSDAHSCSYLFLHELIELEEYIKTVTIEITGQKNKEGIQLLQDSISSEKETDWDLLYPYCKWSSDANCVDFKVDIPADYVIGGGLSKIIKMFEGSKAENQRIVFWFDN